MPALPKGCGTSGEALADDSGTGPAGFPKSSRKGAARVPEDSRTGSEVFPSHARACQTANGLRLMANGSGESGGPGEGDPPAEVAARAADPASRPSQAAGGGEVRVGQEQPRRHRLQQARTARRARWPFSAGPLSAVRSHVDQRASRNSRGTEGGAACAAVQQRTWRAASPPTPWDCRSTAARASGPRRSRGFSRPPVRGGRPGRRASASPPARGQVLRHRNLPVDRQVSRPAARDGRPGRRASAPSPARGQVLRHRNLPVDRQVSRPAARDGRAGRRASAPPPARGQVRGHRNLPVFPAGCGGRPGGLAGISAARRASISASVEMASRKGTPVAT